MNSPACCTAFKLHTILHQSPCCPSPDKASYVLLGGQYDKTSQRVKNAALIRSLIKPDSVLLLEGIRSMERVAEPYVSPLMQIYRISEQTQKNLTCYGWDALNQVVEEDTTPTPLKSIFVGTWEPDHTSTIVEKIEHSTVALEDMSKFHKIRLAKVLARRLSSTEDEPSAEIRKQWEQACSDLAVSIIADEMKSFPARIQKMIETLRKCEGLRASGKLTGTIFLLAGNSFLSESPDGISDARSCLALYQVLDELPSVVAFPKDK